MKSLAHSAPTPSADSGGSALVVALVTLTILFGLSAAYLGYTTQEHGRSRAENSSLRAELLAESAVNQALALYASGGKDAFTNAAWVPSVLGNELDLQVTWGVDDPGMADDLVQFLGSATVDSRSHSVTVLARMAATSDPTLGIVSKSSMAMNSNSVVDAYDSSLGSYGSQVAGMTIGGISYADSDAPVSCNGDIDMDSNAEIHGDANPGPSGSVSTGGSSSVTGSTVPLADPMSFPPVVVPPIASSGSLSFSSGTQTIGPGSIKYTTLDMSSTANLNINGPCTLVLDSAKIDSDSIVTIDATNGPVEIYVNGTFELLSNAQIVSTADDPADLILFAAGSSGDVLLDSNAVFFGRVYAPDRLVTMLSNIQVFGAMVAGDLFMDSNACVHFDKNLLNASSTSSTDLEVITWQTGPST